MSSVLKNEEQSLFVAIFRKPIKAVAFAYALATMIIGKKRKAKLTSIKEGQE